MNKFIKRYISFFFFLQFIHFTNTANNCTGQWSQTNGPYGGYVLSMSVMGNNIFAGTSGGGIFRSTNNGGSWTAVNDGLENLNTNSLAVSVNNIFAGRKKYLQHIFYKFILYKT